jgi:mannose-6-phosphate isomerase-like protein (cupin superfamily)
MIHHQIGDYEVVSHMETPECSLRLLRLTRDKYVQTHHHHKTTQTYFVLDGTIQASVGGKSVTLQQHQSLRIPVDMLHGIRTDKEALVLSISIPPLEGDDQHLATQH